MGYARKDVEKTKKMRMTEQKQDSLCLKQKDIDYINEKGLDVIRLHAQDFIAKREAPAFIPNDGKQTTTKGCTMSGGHRLCPDRSGAQTILYLQHNMQPQPVVGSVSGNGIRCNLAGN